MKSGKGISWAEIYKRWEWLSYRLPEVNEKLEINRVKVNGYIRKDGYFYGWDWIRNEDFASRTDYVANHTTSFLLGGDCLNKGTLRTLEYLAEEENAETRAAIWLYAFLRDAMEHLVDNWRGNGYEIICEVERETLLYLRGKGLEWHHAMKRLLPEPCFSQKLLNAIHLEEIDTVIELAVITADHILSHYKVAEYDSRLSENE